MQNGYETLRVSAIRGSGYGWPRKLKRPPLLSGVRRRMRISRWNGGGEDSGCETSGWNARAPLSGLPQGEAHGTRAYHTPDDSISYPDMLSGWKRPTFRRPPMVCLDALSRHLLQGRLKQNSISDSKELSSISDCFGDQKAINTPKLNTIWLELIARVLNKLIGLKSDKYYSKVFKRVNYKLWNNTFWVVITCL